MRTALDRCLDAIHPDRTRDAIQRRVDEALNGFTVATNIVNDAIEYRELLSRFVERLDRLLGLLPKDGQSPEWMLWGRAVQLLRSTYGPRGDLAAYEMQRSGVEGGLLGVLRKVAAAAVEERVKADVSAWVTSFCGRLSADEYLQVGAEYIRKHGHLLPAEMREGHALRPRLNLIELFKAHHALLVETNRVGR